MHVMQPSYYIRRTFPHFQWPSNNPFAGWCIKLPFHLPFCLPLLGSPCVLPVVLLKTHLVTSSHLGIQEGLPPQQSSLTLLLHGRECIKMHTYIVFGTADLNSIDLEQQVIEC